MKFTSFYIALFISTTIGAQTLVVKPFLQNIEPNSIYVSWETSAGKESTVFWGITPALGSTSRGTAVVGERKSQIHNVQITGLQADTHYYYQTKTNRVLSTISDCYTSPQQNAEKSFRFVAFSDTQQDSDNPTVLSQICNNGVIPYITSQYSSDIAKELAFIMLPGDLVDDGNFHSKWVNTFFGQTANLFKNTPVYPALGNHEYNNPFYFKYFVLPENGTTDYLEHWWYKDYSNVRIIALDSNLMYMTLAQQQSQLTWLQKILDSAALDSKIDFVFLQLHHPFHSELWPEGNLDYTGSVIAKLEAFSTLSGKPSVHFFGHTHGYSRGQSQNATHSMVNVASAGGNIDFWNEYPDQTDYPEFSVSQDDYGFAVIEVEAGANPSFTFKRISMGNANTLLLNNTPTDQFTIKRYNLPPAQPVGISPSENEVVNLSKITLQANPYSDPDGDAQGAAQWQIATDNAFSNIVYDQWRQNEDWYNNVNIQANDDLTNEAVTNLSQNTTYYWRVRYRDQSLGWSPWSFEKSFITQGN